MALALRALGNPARVIVLLGDGELDEGSNHEAIAAASRFGLDNLTAIVIDNASSSLGWPGSIGDRFAIEGWHATTIDGHDHDAIADALSTDPPGPSPRAVVAEVAAR
jgi:transketolase